jgi:hypothetical protein
MEIIPWEIVETRIQGRAMAQVSSRQSRDPDGVPIYSIRIGTAQVLHDGTTRISAHMSIYDVQDARELLQALYEKYVDLRKGQKAERAGIARSYRKPPTP